MKQRMILLLLLCTFILCVAGTALAAYDPIKVSMELSKNTFTGVDSVTVSISVSNVGDDDMPGPVYLYYPDGKAVTDFGDGGAVMLKIGESKPWTGTWKVTQRQLDDGKITFQVKYPIYNDEGNVIFKNKYFNKAIVFDGAAPGLDWKRTINPTMAREGQTVNVIYELTNTGNVALENLKITENKNISSKAQTIDTLKVGESKQITFEKTMGTKNLTSSGKITYRSSNSNKTQTITVDAATIAFGEASLSASLESSAKGVSIGETVKLTLKLKNSGNIDYNNMTVTDPVLGEVFANVTLAAGATDTLEKEITMMSSGEYQFTIVATDSTGTEVSLVTDKVTVGAVDPNKKLTLSVNAEADKLEIYEQPATVRFQVTVTNASETDADKVVLKHGATTIYTFEKIKAGESKTVVRDTTISMAGKFQFTATCKDLLGNDVSFESNPLSIGYAVATPVPTQVPQRTPPPLQQDSLPTSADLPPAVSAIKSGFSVLFYLLMVMLVVSLLLLLIAFVKRAQQKRQSQSALDHLERGTRRDYTLPGEDMAEAEPDDNGENGTDGMPEQENESFHLLDDELPHMKYVRGDTVSQDTTPAEEPSEEDDSPKAEEESSELSEERAAILSGGTGHYRLARPQTSTEPVNSVQAYGRRRRAARGTSGPNNTTTPTAGF